MKIILFLAAVYSLIINQCQQKKTILPLPAPTQQAKPIARDSVHRVSAVTVRYEEDKAKKQAEGLQPYSVLLSW